MQKSLKRRFLNVNKVEPTENLRKTGDDRSVSSRVVVQLKQRSSHKLVVSWYREQSLFRQLNQKQPLVFLGTSAVGRDVGVLRSFKVGPPPVGYYILD